ncbi:MAG: PKD domain-containing protein [Bacteroidota bacterium]
MKRLLTILPILLLALAGCYREPYADAIISPNPAFVGENIKFTNLSSNTDYVEWEMGDGTTSTAFNVTHFYYDPGLYNVKLRAFGSKSDVNTVSFMVDVIGSELTVVVQLWTPIDEPEGYYLEGASVILYPTLEDWEFETNPVAELFTNGAGECTFDGLSYQRYYVDVWEQSHHNYWLAADDVEFIETQLLDGAYYHTFIAYVDYDPDMKKSASTSASRSAQKEWIMLQGPKGEKRDLKTNKISIPRERK